MKRYHLIVFAFSFLILALSFRPLLLAQQPNPSTQSKFEFSTSLSFNGSFVDSSYFSHYSPVFQSGPYVSDATQTVYVKGGQGLGFNAALAYFPSKNFGVQVLAEYFRVPLSGNNSDYITTLNYNVVPSPGPPYPYFYERTYEWPATEGQLREFCLDLNLFLRMELGRMMTLNFSGGPTYFHIRGEATSIGFSTFWIEFGNFWMETTQTKYQFSRANKIGANLGMEFAWLSMGNVGFLLDLRYYYCPPATLQLEVIDAGLCSCPLDEINATLGLGSMRINPSFYRISFGLKYIF